jgi:hypothetical protein
MRRERKKNKLSQSNAEWAEGSIECERAEREIGLCQRMSPNQAL